MLEHEYASMHMLEDTYWWFVARRRLVEDLLLQQPKSNAAKILDVGCGTGATLAMLQRYGDCAGVDSSHHAAVLCRQQRGLRVLEAPIERLPFPDSCFDTITCLDVLEHTDDDLKALRELRRVCHPDGGLIITVPAYGFLWSEHDEALQHRRRYTAHELRNRLTAAGFQVQRCSYFITLLFFPILAVRIWQGLFKKNVLAKTGIRPLPRWLNALFVAVLDFERALMRLINLPFGVSVVVVATPSDSAASAR